MFVIKVWLIRFIIFLSHGLSLLFQLLYPDRIKYTIINLYIYISVSFFVEFPRQQLKRTNGSLYARQNQNSFRIRVPLLRKKLICRVYIRAVPKPYRPFFQRAAVMCVCTHCVSYICALLNLASSALSLFLGFAVSHIRVGFLIPTRNVAFPSPPARV